MTEPEQPLITRPVSRRAFLHGSSLAGFAAFLAACGTSGQTTGPTTAATPPPPTGATPGPTAAATEVPVPTGGGTLNFANWVGYMDITDDQEHYPTLEKFTAETGVEVEYGEGSIDSNEGFFTSDLQPQLSAGLPTDWDIVVVTDWMVARLARLG